MNRLALAPIILLCLAPAAATAQADSASVVAVIEQFHAALAGGDSTAAMALLAPDAVVLEGGYRETRSEYAGGHLSADMAFMSGMKRQISERRVRIEGSLAWVSTTSHMAGEYYGKKIESDGVELMVLLQHETGWLIEAIHWSSAR